MVAIGAELAFGHDLMQSQPTGVGIIPSKRRVASNEEIVESSLEVAQILSIPRTFDAAGA
jgi:hypothetical protein